MIFWQRFVLLLTVCLLTACGQGQVAVDAPTTAMTALKAMQAQDTATLTGLFSPSVGGITSNLVASAIDSFRRRQTELGTPTTYTTEAVTLRGATTVVPIVVAYARGRVRYSFAMAQETGQWKLLKLTVEDLSS